MAETKHTPGPWRVVGESSDHECGYGISSVGTKTDGVFRICNTDMDELEMPEQLANARLMASAPDMLEALEAAQEELRLIRLKDTSAVYDPTVRVRISAAISRARGAREGVAK